VTATPDHAIPDPLKGALAGLAAGLTAAFVMDRFQWALAKAMPSDGGGDQEPATERAADRVARIATGDDVPGDDKPVAGQLVHYALGAALGVAYGIAAEYSPSVTTGFGTAFGTGTAAVLDEAVVPAVGLGDAPWNTGAGTHLYSLASHLVFGGAAEATRRSVRAALS